MRNINILKMTLLVNFTGFFSLRFVYLSGKFTVRREEGTGGERGKEETRDRRERKISHSLVHIYIIS